MQSTYCEPYLGTYSTLTEATLACNRDKQCEGFFDAYGRGDYFRTCGPNLQKHSTGDTGGTFLYEKLNDQAGRILIQLETMIS